MKKNIGSILRKGILPVMICLSGISCKSTFDIEPQDALELNQMYRNVYDADAAIIGIYGKFLGLAKQYLILNELRADLMDITENADDNLRQISVHDVKADNPYASPRPFYELIIACNDVLHNFDMMLADKRMTQLEYNQRYSDIGALRSWLYLQVGIHWGNVPYVTDPLANVTDVTNESKFPKLTFDELLTKLVDFTESLPWKDYYQNGTSLLSPSDNYPTYKFFIVKQLVLGDLNLWKGNYTQAAAHYHEIAEFSSKPNYYGLFGGEELYDYYKESYERLNNNDWQTIFSDSYTSRYQNYENIWMMPFEKTIPRPDNPFIDMFSVNKSYLFKPSDVAISNWDNEVNSSNTVLGDIYRKNGSIRLVNGKYEIRKFLGDYSFLSNPLERTGKWILYRAAQLHLRYAEAANQDNRFRFAYSLINVGVTKLFDYNRSIAGTSGDARNVTYIQQSDPNPSSPYYADGRFGNNPVYRSPWIRQIGPRSRVGLVEIPIDSAQYFDMTTPVRVTFNGAVPTSITYRPLKDNAAAEALKLYMEDKIIKEDALELAFEGSRWPDLLRIALRRKNTDQAYLADKIAAKFASNPALQSTIKQKLMDPKNWYLPFK